MEGAPQDVRKTFWQRDTLNKPLDWNKFPVRYLELRLPRQHRDLCTPERPNKHESSLTAIDADAACKAEKPRSANSCTRLLHHLSAQRVLQRLPRFGPARREIPALAVVADNDDQPIARNANTSRAVVAAFESLRRGVPRDRPALTTGHHRHLDVISHHGDRALMHASVWPT